MSADCVLDAEEIRENVFAEYRQATGDDSAAKYGDIHIRYPEMSFSYPIEINDTEDEDEHSNNTTRSSDLTQHELVDENIKEVK
jgi:hypothetical protein